MDSLNLSRYPHAAEGDLFARHVLSNLPPGPLSSSSSASVERVCGR